MPWDAESMGELEVRGPWVAAGYYEDETQADRWTEDGWFKTGDIVSMHPRGFIQIKDRSKDVIKSGGEWISSVDVENALISRRRCASVSGSWASRARTSSTASYLHAETPVALPSAPRARFPLLDLDADRY